MKSIDLVREFMEKFEQPIADDVNVNDRALNWLRLKLPAEELGELAEALGFEVTFTESDGVLMLSMRARLAGAPDPVETLDALADLQYVLDGAFLSFGMAHLKDAALAEVHRSNLTKLGDDGKPVVRADGKVTKGPRYEAPDLKRVLEEGGR